jgi:hypothetical protein
MPSRTREYPPSCRCAGQALRKKAS